MALTAFRAARLQDCLNDLRGVETNEAAILRARALLRLGAPERALAALERLESSDDRCRGEISLLRAVAYSRTNGEASSNDAMRDAFVYSISCTDAALESEVEFYRGLQSFGRGDIQKAHEACLRAIEVGRSKPAFLRRGGNVPIEHVTSRIEELFGLIHVAQGDYAASQRSIRSSLATLDSCHVKDAFQEGFALKNLSILASDFDATEDARLLQKRIPAFAWTADITRPKFVSFESLGWCSAISGDVAEALRHFRLAADAAKSIPERIHIAVDRAQIAREVGYRAVVTEETDYALTLASSYEWDVAPGEFRNILLPLAQVATSISVSRARRILDLHSRSKIKAEGLGSPTELRFLAEEAFTHGVVLRAEGRLAASSDRLQDAFATWTRIGFKWRAARAALELTEMKSGDIFQLAVRQDLARRPMSVFAERARRVA